MGGLLYKDFVSINRIGKIKLTWFLLVLTIAFLVLRIVFPGTKAIEEFMGTNEQGQAVNMIDVFFTMAVAVLMIFSFSFISVAKIMGNDEKNKIKGYFSSMPIGNNTYIASKYVFLGIATYVFLSLNYIWGIICLAFCAEGNIRDNCSLLLSFIVPIMCLALFIAAIELPLYIRFGKEKSMRVRVVFWTIIAVFVIGYLMFGNLTYIQNFDIDVLVDFVDKHKTGVLLFQSMEPAIIITLYYISYRVSCYLYNKKEGEN